VVCVNIRMAIEEGHVFWLTQSNAIISRAPISRDYIGQIMETNSVDPCGASLYVNEQLCFDAMKEDKAENDLAGAGRGEKRNDKDRKDSPIRLIPREDYVGEQRGEDEVV